MNYLLAVICSIVLLSLMQCMLIRREKIAVIIVLSVIYYFSIYTLLSGLLFWIKEYSLDKCILLTLLVCILGAVIGVWKGDIKEVYLESTIQESWISYICILFLCILFNGFFGYFGMGQDQGVYQVEAINLLYGVTDIQQTIVEYDELPEGEYKAFYQEEIQKQAGYDLLVTSEDIPGIKVDAGTSNVEGMWHGIPTFASILALSAKVFGIINMPIIGTLFFCVFLFVIEFILVNLKVDRFLRALVLLVIGCSPEIIWVKKSTLTEGFLALLIVTYLFLLIQSERKKSIMSVIPIIVFSFFHVTIFTMMPIFVINYWFLFWTTREKHHLLCAKIVAIGYFLGFLMMFSVQPRYTLLNYQFGLSFIPLNAIPIVVFISSIVAFGLTILLEKKVKERVEAEKYIRIYMRIISFIAIAYVILKPIIGNYTYQEFTMITLICYCVLSGSLLLPVVFFILISNKYEYNPKVGTLLLTFSWCIVVYALVMRQDIQHYYYYGRYLAPYISIIGILFAYFGQRYLWKFRIIACIGVVTLVPFSSVFLTNQDDTKLEWSKLTEVLESVEKDSLVLLDTDLMQLFYFPLKASSGVKVYPVINNSFLETIENIDVGEKQVLYLTKDIIEKENSWVEVLYRNKSFSQEDNLKNISPINGLPTDMPPKNYMEISIYSVSSETKEITCLDDEYFVRGWTGRNDLGFRWMNGEAATISGYLKLQDYIMTIHNGNNIPFGHIAKENIKVSIYLNGIYLDMFTITAENAREDKQIEIPKEYITDGYNEISFIGETWSPQEYGNSDKNQYCFSVDYIEFNVKESKK